MLHPRSDAELSRPGLGDAYKALLFSKFYESLAFPLSQAHQGRASGILSTLYVARYLTRGNI